MFDVKNQLSDLFGNKRHRLSITFNNDSKFNGILYMVVLFEDVLVMVNNIAEANELNASKKSDESNRIPLSEVKEIHEIINTIKNNNNPNAEMQLLIYSKEKDYIISKYEYDEKIKEIE